MPAYIVVQGTVTDPQGFAAYAREVSRLVQRLGGRYLAMGSDIETLEGEWPHRSLIIHQWPSLEAARAFWHGPDYAQVRKLREGKGHFVVVLTDGLQVQESL